MDGEGDALARQDARVDADDTARVSESNGPPLLPPPMNAVLWIKTRSSSGLTGARSEALRIPLTIPFVAVKFSPWGCPIAVTVSPERGKCPRAQGKGPGGRRRLFELQDRQIPLLVVGAQTLDAGRVPVLELEHHTALAARAHDVEIGRDQPFVIDQKPAAKADLLPRLVLDVDEHDALVGPLDQIAQPELRLLCSLGFPFLGQLPARPAHQQAGDRGDRDNHRETSLAPIPSQPVIEDLFVLVDAHGNDPWVTGRRGHNRAQDS